MADKLTNDEFQARILQLRNMGKDVFTDDIYIGYKFPMDFYCSKGHHWPATPNQIWHFKTQCPYCSGRYPVVGETDMWTTRPDMAAMLLNPEDGYKYTAQSGRSTTFVCPHCNTPSKKRIGNVYHQGFSCSFCSDNISYPNKFIRAFLIQCDVKNVDYEWNPMWLKPYKYDAYFEYNSQKYVVEMDGKLGHGKEDFQTGGVDVVGIERDKYKDQLAKMHDINVIRIDCNYRAKDRFEYVKQHMLDSELNNLFDLSIIDWVECDRFAQKHFIVETAELYNEGLLIKEIADRLNCARSTTRRWLKQAANIGLCDYNPSEIHQRDGMRKARTANVYTLDGKFLQTFSSRRSVGIFINKTERQVRNATETKKHICGDYLVFNADDPTQPDKSKIITKQND